jgi:hypothetical protein
MLSGERRPQAAPRLVTLLNWSDGRDWISGAASRAPFHGEDRPSCDGAASWTGPCSFRKSPPGDDGGRQGRELPPAFEAAMRLQTSDRSEIMGNASPLPRPLQQAHRSESDHHGDGDLRDARSAESPWTLKISSVDVPFSAESGRSVVWWRHPTVTTVECQRRDATRDRHRPAQRAPARMSPPRSGSAASRHDPGRERRGRWRWQQRRWCARSAHFRHRLGGKL